MNISENCQNQLFMAIRIVEFVKRKVMSELTSQKNQEDKSSFLLSLSSKQMHFKTWTIQF